MRKAYESELESRISKLEKELEETKNKLKNATILNDEYRNLLEAMKPKIDNIINTLER